MAKTETAKDLLMKIITSAISNPEEAASWFAEDGVFEILEPIRKRRRGIVADPSYVVQSLKVGTERASVRGSRRDDEHGKSRAEAELFLKSNA